MGSHVVCYSSGSQYSVDVVELIASNNPLFVPIEGSIYIALSGADSATSSAAAAAAAEGFGEALRRRRR
jgi:hypothetical protein